ncbi:MAG TPA: HIT family protein [Thermoanaerobaculia bacterium]|nr:HIT family protein [Thermoanaerobaculia bacterium]
MNTELQLHRSSFIVHRSSFIVPMTCAFCTDASSSGELVFEDAHAQVLLHNDWSVLGHTMIVARQHVENPSDLEDEAWTHIARIWRRAERVLRDLTKSERVIAMKLGIQTPHLHVHLYPVSGRATRRQIFAAIDGKTRIERDPMFVEQLRELLTAHLD